MSMDDVMRRVGPAGSLGAILAILLVGSGYLSFGVVRVGWFQDRTEASLVVPDSAGLLPRSKVLLTGIQIGEVTSVTHTGQGVEVGLRYDGDYRVPIDSTVRIEVLSGLGEPYIEFRPNAPGGPYLGDGSRVEAAAIVPPVSIPEVARMATTLLEQVDPAAVGSIIDDFTTALAGTELIVPQLSRATDLLAATLLSRTDLLRQLLESMQARAEQLTWAGGELTAAAGPWGDFGPRVADVAASIARVARVGNGADDYMIDTEDEIALVPLLNEVAAKVNKLGPDVRKLLPVFEPLFNLTTGLVGKLDLGALISQALHATTPDGALQLQITVK